MDLYYSCIKPLVDKAKYETKKDITLFSECVEYCPNIAGKIFDILCAINMIL